MSATLTRRGLLLGVGAIAFLPPTRLWAQTGAETLIITSRGSVMVRAGSALSAADSAILGRVGTAIAAKATTRAAATETMNLFAGRLLSLTLRASPIALALAAGLGGAYYMFTGENPLDGLLDLTVGNSAVELRYQAACGNMQVSTGRVSTGDIAPLGPFNSSTTGGCTPRARMMVELDTSSNPNGSSLTADGWVSEGTYSYRPDPAVNKLSYRFYYTKPLSTAGGVIRYPKGANLKDMLTASQKAQLITEGALNAVSAGAWKEAQGWADGGFTGGGGGEFGGGGATGTWGVEYDKDAIMGGNTTVRGGVKGSTSPRPNPTWEEMTTPRGPVSNPPKFEFPSDPIFPDDPGYNSDGGGGVNNPPPTGGGGSTNPGTGGSTGPDCYPGQVQCPTKVDWGSPPSKETDDGVGEISPMEWFPSPFTPPTIPVNCQGFGANFRGLGAVSIDPCPNLDKLFPVIKPIVVIGGTIEAGRTLLDI